MLLHSGRHALTGLGLPGPHFSDVGKHFEPPRQLLFDVHLVIWPEDFVGPACISSGEGSVSLSGETDLPSSILNVEGCAVRSGGVSVVEVLRAEGKPVEPATHRDGLSHAAAAASRHRRVILKTLSSV
jgi:hypothetical protein